MKINPLRARALLERPAGDGPVVYWMRRDQRLRDNWALCFARQLADLRRAPLAIAFCLVPRYLEASWRQYAFMIDGLRQLERSSARLGIPFWLVRGDPKVQVPHLIGRLRAGALVTDFSPLRIARQWNRGVSERLDVPFWEVDAHNIVPCWEASNKQEYAARTIRPKINKRLAEFMDPLPALRRQTLAWPGDLPRNDWPSAVRQVKASRRIGEVDGFAPGEKAARRALRRFVAKRLACYAEASNDPARPCQSELSPYLHFGQLSAQRIAAEVLRSDRHLAARDAFLEQLVVRRELADNFCHYNDRYDRYDGFPAWARRSLEEHLGDRRGHLYTQAQFEKAATHDALWNAAQQELILTGKMHGYLRMYWAKKILEWTEHPEEAHGIAITLNDRYELDGRDPNGYVGVAWSIGGVHDRPWFERPVFGKVRYMSNGGCRRKFDVGKYIDTVAKLAADRSGSSR